MPVTGRLARQLITTFTRTGGLVVDIHPADHTLVANAVILGRRASAVVTDTNRAGVIWTWAPNSRDKGDGRTVEERVARAEAPNAAMALPRGEAALAVLRRTCETRTRACSAGGPPEESFLSGCAALLARGGHLAVVTGVHLVHGRPHDPVPGTIREAQRAGLVYLQHIVAVHGPVRRRGIVLSLLPATVARATVAPPHVFMAVRAHADVLIFTKPSSLPVAARMYLRAEEE
ncbi:hypothetical protein N5079_27165 [Planotetraspora sp. A-T 1434]|uniref:hypothetical protein n=1 Tax=Planotetraspora sp. A-T 1434 TaxID=2979219 RepID=UPI0021C122E4|nr:hypothetical protein [Planotetraspora sp. A-T 1434]MCT9933898.1 hypothetical protein [Planotetraspora sp. A-T 1434]